MLNKGKDYAKFSRGAGRFGKMLPSGVLILLSFFSDFLFHDRRLFH